MSFYVFKKVLGNGFIKGSLPPLDKNLQWIDTSAEKPLLKVFNEETEKWIELSPEDITSQVNKLGVTATTTAPRVIDIDIPATLNFALKPIQVLKLIPAKTNFSQTQMNFNNADSTSFIYNEKEIAFDGTMFQKKEFTFDLVSQGAIGLGHLSSYTIKKNHFKTFVKMEVL